MNYRDQFDHLGDQFDHLGDQIEMPWAWHELVISALLVAVISALASGVLA